LLDLDKLRKARNEIAHYWDIGSLKEFFETGPVSTLFAIDGLFGNYPEFTDKLDRLDGSRRFRARLIWLVARLFYETNVYQRAKVVGINPSEALYGERRPKLHGQITDVYLAAHRRLLE
jgi:hypothetical protein